MDGVPMISPYAEVARLFAWAASSPAKVAGAFAASDPWAESARRDVAEATVVAVVNAALRPGAGSDAVALRALTQFQTWYPDVSYPLVEVLTGENSMPLVNALRVSAKLASAVDAQLLRAPAGVDLDRTAAVLGQAYADAGTYTRTKGKQTVADEVAKTFLRALQDLRPGMVPEARQAALRLYERDPDIGAPLLHATRKALPEREELIAGLKEAGQRAHWLAQLARDAGPAAPSARTRGWRGAGEQQRTGFGRTPRSFFGRGFLGLVAIGVMVTAAGHPAGSNSTAEPRLDQTTPAYAPQTSPTSPPPDARFTTAELTTGQRSTTTLPSRSPQVTGSSSPRR